MRPRDQMGGSGGFMGMTFTYAVVRLMIVTAAASIIGGVALVWFEAAWPELLQLEPQAVWGDHQGVLNGIPAAWQPITCLFFEFNWLQLIFVMLMYGWFAGALESAWGTRRFLINLAILGVGSGVLTVLMGLVWPAVRESHYSSAMAVMEGLIIVWALTWPNRQVLAFFVIPMKGFHFIYLILGILGLRILFGGQAALVALIPEIFGVLIGFGLMFRALNFRKLGLRVKQLQIQQQLRREQAKRQSSAKRAEELGLRVVDVDDDEPDDGDEEPPQYLH